MSHFLIIGPLTHDKHMDWTLQRLIAKVYIENTIFFVSVALQTRDASQTHEVFNQQLHFHSIIADAGSLHILLLI